MVLPAASAAHAVSLTEAVELAIATNPDIGIVANNREAVDEELRQARGLWLPQIDAAAGIGYERTEDRGTRADTTISGSSLALQRKESSLTVQQRVFDGFEANSTIDREKARVESAARRVFENAETLALDAIGTYLEVIRQRELVRLAEQNLDIHLSILDAVRERLDRGAGSRADVVQTEARSARARSTLTQTLNDLRDGEAAFTRVVGQFPDELDAPEFPETVLPADLDSAVTAAANNPDLRVFEADVREAEATVSLAEAPFYPAVTLEGEAEYNDERDGINSDEFNQQIMLRLRWNLFRGGIDRANRQEALARVSESKNRRYQSYLEAQREMRQSWFALESNRQRVDDLSDAVRFNMETRDAYRQQFEVAQRTLLDVLDAENELFVSSGLLVTAQTNELLASYRILAVAGQLLQTLGVAAPEQAVVEHTDWFEGVGIHR